MDPLKQFFFLAIDDSILFRDDGKPPRPRDGFAEAVRVPKPRLVDGCLPRAPLSA